jgi:UDP-GlcNAc:undecaprenyl-phosphate GlcNAc-1-phosphate transferase
VAIVAGLALAACGVAMMQWREWGIAVGRSELVALGIGTLLVFLVGVVDDVLGVSVTKKLLFQLAAAYLLVQLGWSFQVLHLPGLGDVQLGVWGDLVSLLWIVGVTNAINLIDGLDGLAGGVVAIIALGLLTQALLQGEPLTVVLMGAMAGATIGFLAHNWSPARIFMGDSGSLTLGFLLAVMSVHSSLKAPAAVAILIPVLALGLPVIDTLLVMGVRFLDQPHGRLGDRFLRMFHADRNHLHHTLERFVANRRRIVGSIYGAVLVFCVMALAVAITRNATLGLVLVCVQVAAVVVMRNWGRLVQTGGRLVRAGPQVISAGNGALRKGQDVARVLPAGRKRRRQG